VPQAGNQVRLVLVCLSGDTPGDREGLAFRTRELRCAARIMAHAGPDSLRHSAALSSMHSSTVIARLLSTAFLAGELEIDGMVARAGHLLGRRYRWLRPLAGRVHAMFGTGNRPGQRVLAKYLLADAGFARARRKCRLRVRNPVPFLPVMSARGKPASWDVPVLCTATDLADWLGITLRNLSWFADRGSLELERSSRRLRHYHYRVLAKRFGRVRLIEAPKPRLKQLQQRILDGILRQVPAHDAAHGFRRGRSIISFATPHVGQRVVLKIDLEDFFPSISSRRVVAICRTIGYPDEVASLLAGLCTNAAPESVWQELEAESGSWQTGGAQGRYSKAHLPQGAPTSPALANLCAYRMDCRLSGLASSVNAVYTRYADDLVFSGDGQFERCVQRFRHHVCATVMEEGFRVHARKTRVMQQGVCQYMAGLVVNQHFNIRRGDFDRLKAILTNCHHHGPASQNRSGHPGFRAHLDGRISFVEMVNPIRGGKLRRLFERIKW
jgi:RNA-directed DNA polymerase